MLENQQYDKKSITFLKDKNTDWDELAKDCVCFANASGGKILLALKMMPKCHQKDETDLRNWLGRLIDLKLVQSKGKPKGTEYFINPDYLRKLNFKGKTDLKKIESYRLQELIYQDLTAYPESQIGDYSYPHR